MFLELVFLYVSSIIIGFNCQFAFKISNILKLKCVAPKNLLGYSEVTLTNLQRQEAFHGS